MCEANEIEYWASLGNLTQVKKAYANGHDVNAVGQDGYTAMHAAAENNHLEVLKFLVTHGGQVDAKVVSGKTPLDLARISGSTDAEEYLNSVKE